MLESLGLPNFLAGAYSVRPPASHHVSGRQSIGLKAAVLQTLAMLAVYLVKLAFEYWVLTRPMVEPVRALLAICWPCIDGWPMLKLNWLLVVLRFAPAIVLCQVCARHPRRLPAPQPSTSPLGRRGPD